MKTLATLFTPVLSGLRAALLGLALCAAAPAAQAQAGGTVGATTAPDGSSAVTRIAQ